MKKQMSLAGQEKRKETLEELRSLKSNIEDLITQLETADVAYFSSHELASVIEAFGLTWSVGEDPRDKSRKFMAYWPTR